MAFPLPVPDELRRRLAPGTEVLLGLSGGVDSAVTLALLHELGCRVQCVTFKNFCYGESDLELPEKSCCSLDAIQDARALAHRFGAQHWVHDLAEPFALNVIEPFVQEYRDGRTPNPCLNCNGDVRFPELVRLADRQGCAIAATGHYARIVDGARGYELHCGLDPKKDQSYFLSRLNPALLPRLLFPLGWWNKDQIREAARALQLSVAQKPDSQEICFVPDGDRSFLFPEDAATQPGEIVDRAGRVLGQHRGLVHYTVGQRKGLGVAAAHPLYVLELDLARCRLVVGSAEDLTVYELRADGFRSLVDDLTDTFAPAEPLRVRIRHRHEGAAVKEWNLTGDRLHVLLSEPVRGAAPGQGLALYAGDRVLGCGRLIGTGGARE